MFLVTYHNLHPPIWLGTEQWNYTTHWPPPLGEGSTRRWTVIFKVAVMTVTVVASETSHLYLLCFLGASETNFLRMLAVYSVVTEKKSDGLLCVHLRWQKNHSQLGQKCHQLGMSLKFISNIQGVMQKQFIEWLMSWWSGYQYIKHIINTSWTCHGNQNCDTPYKETHRMIHPRRHSALFVVL